MKKVTFFLVFLIWYGKNPYFCRSIILDLEAKYQQLRVLETEIY